MQWVELAPAKINLFLHVCGKRADGYHLLDSLVAFTAHGDRILARPAPSLNLEITGPFAGDLSAGEDNLVLKTARFLARRTSPNTGVHISLEKNLPVASGIGGGSSDAAAALRACGEIWQTPLTDLTPAVLAAELGADVPVCVARAPCRMQGIGDVLLPAPALPSGGLVLVNPHRPLATAPVFKALAGRYTGPAPALPACFADMRALATFLSRTTNDLAAPAVELLPNIRDVLNALAGTDACLLARMSGSGPTCFGLFDSRAQADGAADSLRTAHPDWWIVATSFLHQGA